MKPKRDLRTVGGRIPEGFHEFRSHKYFLCFTVSAFIK